MLKRKPRTFTRFGLTSTRNDKSFERNRLIILSQKDGDFHYFAVEEPPELHSGARLAARLKAKIIVNGSEFNNAGEMSVEDRHFYHEALEAAFPPGIALFNGEARKLFTHVKHLAAIMAALGILFGLWFGIATYHAPRPSYPYYDTQNPVPTWSEPAPLQGNRDRGGKNE
jgi:hypothetical protein